MDMWNTNFQQFGWIDLIDVTLLTLVCFRLYLWLRGTVALHVVAGLALLGIGSLLANRWGLLLTTYALQAVGAVAAILVVVVFQDELRQALRGASALWLWQRGRSQWRRRREDPYDTFAEGLARLAAKRIGALVVLPRLDRVDDHLTGGAQMDARVGPDLLEGLFHTRSPVHDGAMVMQGDRLTRAGSVLPLSAAANLPEHLGTRHRAALGLSERCDALVVVVSEERGEVSVAEGGKLTTLEASGEEPLAARIAAKVRAGMTDVPKPWKHVDRHSLGRRFISGFVAFLVILCGMGWAWFSLVGDRSTMVNEERAVELRALPEDSSLTILSPKSGKVQIRLRGPRSLLVPENLQKVRIWVDLGDVKPGYRKVKVQVKVPVGLRIVEVSPEQMNVLIKRKQAGK
ncbi:MAG: diadenylate cyclase [Polyangia bacterium]|jgi:uncharacterized protein (TIGR00159 family)|nr:diadenylate cyclase [Polyangia bacterium]